MYKTSNKVHISGDLRTIHYKDMYTGGNLTIRAQNLCRTETLPKSHANNDAAMWLAYNTNGLYTVSLNNKWSDRIISCWIRGTRAFIHQQRPDLVSKAHAMIMDMTLICRKAADDQVGQYIMHGGIAGYLVGVETSFHTTRTQTTPFGTRAGKDVAWQHCCSIELILLQESLKNQNVLLQNLRSWCSYLVIPCPAKSHPTSGDCHVHLLSSRRLDLSLNRIVRWVCTLLQPWCHLASVLVVCLSFLYRHPFPA